LAKCVQYNLARSRISFLYHRICEFTLSGRYRGGLQQRAELLTGAWSEQGPIRFLCLFDLLFGLDITFTAIAKWAQQPTRANRQQAIGMVLEHAELRDDYRCRNVKPSSRSLP
jgi:hypothetical protein